MTSGMQKSCYTVNKLTTQPFHALSRCGTAEAARSCARPLWAPETSRSRPRNHPLGPLD